MFDRKYRVAEGRTLTRGDNKVFEAGSELTDADFATSTGAINISALLDGGFLEVIDAEKEACPACAAEKMKRPPKFESFEEMAEHYREKHPALAPPVGEG